MIKREVWYFPGVGPQNTTACLELMEKAVAEGLRHLVVASTTGDSGAQAARRLRLELIWEFDHNGIFHLLQTAGLMLLCQGISEGG